MHHKAHHEGTSRTGAAEGTDLEEVSQLGVAVGDVRRLGRERLKDVAQAAQRLVDGTGLLGPLPLSLRPCQSLAAPCISKPLSAARLMSHHIIEVHAAETSALLVITS